MACSDGRLDGILLRLWYSRHPAVRLLWPVGALTGLLTRLRRLCYRRGYLRAERVDGPVVIVGNLSVGGTGKTPVVVWLARALVARGIRPGIVCRGYGGSPAGGPRLVDAHSSAAEVGDEALVLARETGVPVAVCRDRVAAARLLVNSERCQLVISDDGLQHLRLHRDFEIVVVDGARGFGNGLCLPVGPLREPVARLSDVDAIVINGEQAVAGIPGGKGAPLHFAVTPAAARGPGSAGTVPIGQFKGARVHAVAAIGNPARFFGSLESCGIEVVAHPHRDHAVLEPADFEFGDGLPVMTTLKDAVKYPAGNMPNVWVVSAELRFAAGAGAALIDRIAGLLERPSGRQ